MFLRSSVRAAAAVAVLGLVAVMAGCDDQVMSRIEPGGTGAAARNSVTGNAGGNGGVATHTNPPGGPSRATSPTGGAGSTSGAAGASNPSAGTTSSGSTDHGQSARGATTTTTGRESGRP